MIVLQRSWTDAELIADAAKYSTRTDWKRESSAYFVAQSRGILGICCASMALNYKATTADIIYIWRVVGWSFNGEQVYKIGVTSKRLKDERIKQVAKAAECEADLVLMIEVPAGDAYEIERNLLTLGYDPKFDGFDGATEMRAMSEAQLQVAIETAVKHACS